MYPSEALDCTKTIENPFLKILLVLGQKKSRNNLNSAVSALIGRGIRTSPVTKIKDFEQVPENLVTRLARNKNITRYQNQRF